MYKHGYLKYLQGLALLTVALLSMVIACIGPGNHYADQVISRGSCGVGLVLIPLVLIALAYRREGWLKYLYVSGLLALFYGLLLKWFWTTGFTYTTQLWGVFPTSDASGYYTEASGLLVGDPLNGSSTFRPIFTLFYSSVLWMTNANLLASFTVIAFLNVLGSLIASNEVRKTHGALAAALYVTAGLLFYKYYIGTVMSEQLGFLLGNLAFACFWNGIQIKNRERILIGLFVLSLGLNVRAGAMFILLTLAVWVGFQVGEKKFSFRWSGIALLVAASGFLVNTLMTNAFASNNGAMFSNFGYTLYGVAVGNKGWTQILTDHPGVTASESTQVAIQQIIRDPLLFVKGVLIAYRDYFDPTTWWAFQFLRLGPRNSNMQNSIVWVFFLLGSAYVLKHWNKPLPRFLIFAFAGILLSVPFAPTRDVGYRSYTVTNPILSSLLFMSFPWFTQVWRRLRKKEVVAPTGLSLIEMKQDAVFSLVYPLFAAIVALALVLPFFAFVFRPFKLEAPSLACKQDELSFSFWTNRNAWVQVVPEEDLPEGVSIPYATRDTLTQLLTSSAYHSVRSYADTVQHAVPGNVIGYAPYYYLPGDTVPTFVGGWIVANSSSLPKSSGVIQFCGKEVTTELEGKPFVRTYVATNLSVDCATCGTPPYSAGVTDLSAYGAMALVLVVLVDSTYSQYIRIKKRRESSQN